MRSSKLVAHSQYDHLHGVASQQLPELEPQPTKTCSLPAMESYNAEPRILQFGGHGMEVDNSAAAWPKLKGVLMEIDWTAGKVATREVRANPEAVSQVRSRQWCTKPHTSVNAKDPYIVQPGTCGIGRTTAPSTVKIQFCDVVSAQRGVSARARAFR